MAQKTTNLPVARARTRSPRERVLVSALTNTLSRGDRVLALATGRFVVFWAIMAERLGIEVDLIDFGKSSSIDLNQVEDKLNADYEKSYQAVLVVQTDTAVSV